MRMKLHHAWTSRYLKRRSRRKPRARAHAQEHLNFEGIVQGYEMKRPSVLVLLIFAFVGGNLFMGISSSARIAQNSSEPGYGSIELNGRRLKERYTSTVRKTRGLEKTRTDDYQPVDPSPSSKATIRPGPIEHGTPILPYVPRYPPPTGHPKDTPPAESPGSPFT
ncbi:uncharacterized protein LOC133914448 [Phragmites australis]|uniref:uncharacterized protein LOC133914448 n=1 Tax=Phragmites australis TaxID=29695 RepID=UPI002D76BD74|nr:uncharacterized protein LOC133914448 [Phragmites australis]